MRFIFLLFSFSFSTLQAQQFFNQGNSVPVISNGVLLTMPWVGGLNTPQFSEIDINLDGVTDLVAYDSDAKMYIPFVHNPNVHYGEYGYDYIPKYNTIFPKSIYWGLFRDLNSDGKDDLLTSSSGGMNYYKNTSTLNSPSFEFVETLISKRGSAPIPLFTNNVDIPIIQDMDFDGDIDVVTFEPDGKKLEFNENISTTPGEYSFKVTDKCWGNFSENDLTNSILLNDPTCITQMQHTKMASPLHAGATLAAYDLDNDNDMEVFIGDVSYNNITQLTNTPIDGEDHMTNMNPNFPTSHSIDITFFPAIFFIDFDKDGKKDMLVSPATGNASNSKQSVWYYKNIGSNELPNFEFIKTNAIQDQMIDQGRYSKVRLFDYNQDNNMDIIVSGGQTLSASGLTSTLSLYKNIGSQLEPKFSLLTENFGGINAFNLGVNLCPSFADLDGDGLEDMIIGKNDGTFSYFKNNSNSSNPWNFTINTTLLNGLDVGYNATPVLYDIDNDGLVDLLAGNRKGRITYYKNTGSSTSPAFSHISSFLGEIDIKTSTAQGFLDFDIIVEDGNTVIYAGTSASGLNRIENIDGNLTGAFLIADSNVKNLEHVRHISPVLYDFNYDGYLDMLTGNIRGGVEYFHGIDELWVSTPEYTKKHTSIYPNPAKNNLHIDSEVQWLNYSIISSHGAIIQQNKFLSDININELQNGYYFLKLTNNQTQETLKFIKE